MSGHIDLEPRRELGGIGGDFLFEVGGQGPSYGLHLVWIGRDRERVRCVSEVDVDDFVFDHAAADIGAVFKLSAVSAVEAFDAEFFVKPPCGALGGIFVPVGVRAAGVRP